MSKRVNRKAHEAFIKGEATFTTLSKEGLDDSRTYFEEAISLEPGYARAMAELSYAYVHTATAGWHTPQEAVEALAKAEVYSKLAVQLDPEDYDTHWARGFYYMNSGKKGDFRKGIRAFEKAKDLFENCTDLIDRKPGLLAEMGEALVYDGRPREGIELIDRAISLVPDWYRWNMAFACYCDKQYQRAIDELDKMYRKLGDPRYLYDSFLTRAAAHAQLGQSKQARKAVKDFRRIKKANSGKDWTIQDELKRTPFRDDKNGYALRDHWIEGLRQAGLPE